MRTVFSHQAPEFWPGQQGQEHFHTHKVDLWSLGLVTFECMTGRRPFYPFVDPQKVIREIPKKQQDHICTTFSMGLFYIKINLKS